MNRFRLATLATTLCLIGCNSASTILAPLENNLVYQPTDSPPATWSPPDLVKEDVWFTTDDGVKLHGWYCPVENPRAFVLFAHGNGGNLADRWERIRLLTNRLGVTVLAFDYRGYGHSEGRPTEQGVLLDARTARRFLSTKAGIAEADIVLYGQSLGGGVVVDLAAHDGARGLILESTFTSLAAVANYKFPLTPPGRILGNRFDSITKIADYHGPLVIIHGENDRLVPISQAKSLYAAAHEPKSFVAIAGAGHNWKPTLEVIAALDVLLRELPPAAPNDTHPRREGVKS